MRRCHKPEQGAAAVEFALILPVFSLMLFGTIQYSMYFWSAQSAADAAREGARRGAVGQTCSDLTSMTTGLVKLETATPTVTRRYYAATDTTFSTPITLSSTNAVDANVRIRITYNSSDLNIPFIPFPAQGAVTETAVSRVESFKPATPNPKWVACP
jgi:Flp pilus assembly protein TadG